MREIVGTLVLVFSFVFQTLRAQDSAEYIILDSLKYVKDTTQNDSIKFHAYRKISSVNVDVDTLEKYAFEYLKYAQLADNKQNTIIAEYILGRVNMMKSDWGKAISWTMKAQNLADSTNDPKYRSYSRTQLAAIFSNINDLNSMMTVSNEALEISEATNDSASMPWAYYMIGALYNQIYMFDNAENFFIKGLDISQAAHDKYSEANIRQAIASNMVQKYQHNDLKDNELKILYKARDVVFQNVYDNDISLMFQVSSIGTICETYKEIYQLRKNPTDLDSAIYFLNLGRAKIKEYNMTLYDNIFNSLEIYLDALQGNLGKADKIIKSYKNIEATVYNEVDGIKVLEAIIFYYKKTKNYKGQLDAMLVQRIARDKNYSLEFGISQVHLDIQHSYSQMIKQEEERMRDLEFQMELQQKREKVFDIFLSYLAAIAGCFVIYFIVKYIIHSRTNHQLKRQSKELMAQKDVLEMHQAEIQQYNDEIENQKASISEQSMNLKQTYESQRNSMEFAKRIQLAVMHSEDSVGEIFKDNFVYFNPKEAVSGDFYWARESEGHRILAVGDCTGHGVPGGMLSILGISSLNIILNQNPKASPAEILENLKTKFFNTINDTTNEQNVDDGMDIVLISLDGDKLTFASAGRPLLMIRNKVATIFRGDRRTIGNGISAVEKFNNQEITTQNGDMFYLFSDGITDQFGGTSTKSKFSIKRLQLLLTEISNYPLYAQREAIIHTISQWIQKSESQKYPQIDDQLIIGVRIAF